MVWLRQMVVEVQWEVGMEVGWVNSPDGLIPTASLRRLLDFLQGHRDAAEEQIHPVATVSWHQNMGRMGIDGIE